MENIGAGTGRTLRRQFKSLQRDSEGDVGTFGTWTSQSTLSTTKRWKTFHIPYQAVFPMDIRLSGALRLCGLTCK